MLQKHHVSQYDYHHKQPSYRVKSTLVRALLYEQFLGEYQILDNNGPQILWHFYQALRPECDSLRYLFHFLYQQLWERYGLGQLWFYQETGHFYLPFLTPQKPVDWLLRVLNVYQYIIDRYHHQRHVPHVRPRSYHTKF